MCMAYAGEDLVKPQCRVLNFMDRLTKMLRPTPKVPPAPKVF